MENDEVIYGPPAPPGRCARCGLAKGHEGWCPDGRVEVLGDVEVPDKFFRRISLGVQVLDEIFGGTDMPGILPGASYLFTGTPGAGKSTMCLQLAELFQVYAGRNVLYNLGEENKNMIKLRADRIGIKGRFGISHFEDVDELIAETRKRGVEILFQDSLQSLRAVDEGRRNELRGHTRLIEVTKRLHRLAKEDDVTIFIVGHSVKGGKFAGPNEIKHEVDGHAHLQLNLDSGNRVFELEKNRWGPACMPYEFVLSAQGLDFHQLPAEEEGKPNGGRAAERRDQVRTLIREKLMEGEFLSGYCFERLGVDCSGGFWRGMLAKVVRELQVEGMKVAERRIDGRLHSFIDVGDEEREGGADGKTTDEEGREEGI